MPVCCRYAVCSEGGAGAGQILSSRGCAKQRFPPPSHPARSCLASPLKRVEQQPAKPSNPAGEVPPATEKRPCTESWRPGAKENKP